MLSTSQLVKIMVKQERLNVCYLGLTPVIIFLVFILGLIGCSMTNRLQSGNNYFPNQDFIEATKFGLLRSQTSFPSNYKGHYINPLVWEIIKKSDMDNQSVILIYSLTKLNACSFDGELAYEFKDLFMRPYGFEEVANEALIISKKNLNHNSNYDNQSLLKAICWIHHNLNPRANQVNGTRQPMALAVPTHKNLNPRANQ